MDAHEAQNRARSTVEASSRAVDLGDLSAQSSDHGSAVTHYREALAALTEATGDVRAGILRRLSHSLLMLGETVEARAAIQEAQFALTDEAAVDERARVQIQLGRVRLAEANVDAAMTCADAAVTLLQDRAPSVDLARALHFRGVVAYRLDRRDAAKSDYQSALRAYKDLGDLIGVARVYADIGMIHKDACNWSRALESYQVSQSLMQNEGYILGMASVLQNIGIAHLRMGNLVEASTYFDRSLRTARQVSDPVRAALALLGKAEIHQQRGEHRQARRDYQDALETCLLHQYVFGTAIAYVGLAQVALGAGDTDDARAIWEKARHAVARAGNRGDAHIEALLVAARLALASGDAAAALESAETARTESVRTGAKIAESRALAVLAQAHMAAGRVEQADDLLETAAETLRRVGEGYHLAEVLELHARVNLGADEDRRRLAGMQQLLEAAERYRSLRLPAAEARVLLALAREDIRQRAVDRATERIEKARSLTADMTDATAVEKEIADIQRLLERSFVHNAVSTLESFNAQRQMERVLKSERDFGEKIAEFLRVLGRSIPCDGAAVVEIGENEMKAVGTHAISGLEISRTYVRPRALSGSDWPANAQPLVFLGLDDPKRNADLGPLTEGRQVVSALAVPLRDGGRRFAVLYVDRVAEGANPHFHQAEVNYCVALARQLAAFLEEAGIRNRRGLRELDRAERHIALADIVTQNPEMQGILGLVSRVASSNLTVLLQGETGTGKKLIARALHECSTREGKPFVTVDCAALPESVIEGELFGYTKGAFTGAVEDRAGILEQADGGTVFLDEIDKTSIAVQRRFLHLLDVGEVRPVGGRSYRRLDIRVVCATSAPDLRAEVQAGRFIKDLYFRLNDIGIHVPPLRERSEDIPLLAEYFTDLFAQETGRDVPGISQMAMRKLTDYEWPGNVRELEKVIRRAVTLADEGETLGLDLLPPRLLEEPADDLAVPAEAAGDTLRAQLDAVEKRLVAKALEEHDWNKSRAAVALGLSRKGLKNKIARYGLDRRRRT
jgi:transcriptional regulator with GAF, ATPase, and Fis domain